MFQEYINKALQNSQYKILEDGSWFATVKELDGVWANCSSVEETRQELIEVIEEWLIMKLRDNDSIPLIENVGVGFKVKEELEYA